MIDERGEEGLLKIIFKDLTYERSKTHRVVVRNVLWATVLCIGHMVAKRQSIGTTAVVRESANRLDKG